MDHKYPSDEAERRRAKRSEGQLVHRTVEAEAHDLSADRCESVSPFHTACVLVSGHRIPHCGPGDRYERCTEERMALDYELSADDKSTPGPADTPGRGSTGPGHSRPAGDDVGDEDPTYTQAHEDSR